MVALKSWASPDHTHNLSGWGIHLKSSAEHIGQNLSDCSVYDEELHPSQSFSPASIENTLHMELENTSGKIYKVILKIIWLWSHPAGHIGCSLRTMYPFTNIKGFFQWQITRVKGVWSHRQVLCFIRLYRNTCSIHVLYKYIVSLSHFQHQHLWNKLSLHQNELLGLKKQCCYVESPQ